LPDLINASDSVSGRLSFSNSEQGDYDPAVAAAQYSLHAMETWNGPQRKIWQVDLTPALAGSALSVSGHQTTCPPT